MPEIAAATRKYYLAREGICKVIIIGHSLQTGGECRTLYMQLGLRGGKIGPEVPVLFQQPLYGL